MVNPLGVGPIGWVNDDLRDWGAERSGEEVMAEIAGLGLNGTEMSYRFPQDPAELKAALAGHGLVLSAAYRWANLASEQFHDEELELARQHVDFCHAAGARFATFAEGTGSQHWDRRGPAQQVTQLDEKGWERLLSGLHRTGEYARSLGVRVTVHPHGGTAIETAEHTDRLLSSLDPDLAGWCLDTGHVLYGGADPVELSRRWAHRVDYVHLKDVRAEVLQQARAAGWDFATAVRNNIFCTPGAGLIDFRPVIAALRDVGYSGWYIIEAEQDPARFDARTVTADALRYLDRELGLKGTAE